MIIEIFHETGHYGNDLVYPKKYSDPEGYDDDPGDHIAIDIYFNGDKQAFDKYHGNSIEDPDKGKGSYMRSAREIVKSKSDSPEGKKDLPKVTNLDLGHTLTQWINMGIPFHSN